MPGRAILNPFLSQIKGGTRPAIKSCFQCLEHCDIRTIPYCITMALVYAAEGDTDHGLLFCGSNAYRAEKIDTVDNVMKELTGELLNAGSFFLILQGIYVIRNNGTTLIPR